MSFIKYLLWLAIVVVVQVPAWLWAKCRGRSYHWWGGPQG